MRWNGPHNCLEQKTRTIRVWVMAVALGVAFGFVTASLDAVSAQDRKSVGATYSPKRMTDGKEWTTHNLNVNTVPSYCYEGAESNCRQTPFERIEMLVCAVARREPQLALNAME